MKELKRLIVYKLRYQQMGKGKQYQSWIQARSYEKTALKLMRQGSFQAARFYVRSLLKMNPEHADAYYLLSVIERRTNEPKLVQVSTSKSTQKQPNCELSKMTSIQMKLNKQEQSVEREEEETVCEEKKQEQQIKIQEKKEETKQKEQQNPKSMDKKKKKSEMFLSHAINLNKNGSQTYDGKVSKFQNNQVNKQTRIIKVLLEKSDKITGKQKNLMDKDSLRTMTSAWYESMEIYANKGDKCGAKAVIQAIMEYFNIHKYHQPQKFNERLSAISLLGLHLYDFGFYSYGYDLLKLIAYMNKRDHVYHNNLSILCYILGRYEEGKRLLQISQNNNHGYPRTSYVRSFIDMKMNDFEGALASIKNCIAKKPKTVFYYFKKVTILGLCHLYGIKKEQVQTQEIKQSIREFETCLQKAVEIMKNNQNDDSALLRPKFIPDAKKGILLIEDIYKKYGVQGFNIQIFRQYLTLFDDFLIFGNTDRVGITSRLAKLGNVIKKMEKIAIEEDEKNQQSEEETLEIQKKPQFNPPMPRIIDDDDGPIW